MRLMPAADSPDPAVIRAAVREKYPNHLAYTGSLSVRARLARRPPLTYADLAAAAHLSAADYLGNMPWTKDDPAQHGMRSCKRGPLRSMLTESWRGVVRQ